MSPYALMVGLVGVGFLAVPAAAAELNYDMIWEVQHSIGTNSVAHAGDRAYVASGTTLHVLKLKSGHQVGQVDIDSVRFGAITSVAAHGNLVAITVTAVKKSDASWVQIYRAPSMSLILEREVGFGADMSVFSPQGDKILVANEGEPECRDENGSAILVDYQGSISVVDPIALSVETVGFEAFNGDEDRLIAEGVRIFGTGATAALDLEPEHIAVDPSGQWAWVTLQENNAIAKLDLRQNSPHVIDIIALGDKNYSEPSNELDLNKSDGAIRKAHPNVFGMYQPDGIVAGKIGDGTYLLTANEGDARKYELPDKTKCYSEEDRATNANLNSSVFTQDEAGALVGLRITNTRGKSGGVGSYQSLYTFGGRSFAIWDADGNMVYDSGSAIEDFLGTSTAYPYYFYDARSGDKGPEPEEVAWGVVDGGSYLFVGLERANGVIVFDFSQVTDVSQVTNVEVAAFLGNPPEPLDLPGREGEFPERLDFVPALESATGKALLLVTNEISGKTRAFELTTKS